ncbi:MAG: hypothetical protein RX316_02350 [bacterium]|nr:hypothetical protein [bacterium]
MADDRRASTTAPSGPPAWQRHATMAPLYVAAALLVYFALSASVYWAQAARYPYGLENGEGWVLTSAVQLASGQSPYGTLEDYPYVVGNYPPLYLLATAAAIRTWGFSPLYGRLLSLAALAVCAALVVLVARRMGVAWLVAVLGGLYYLTIPGMRIVAPQVRVDMVAAALTFAGIAWLAWSEEGRGVVVPAVFFAAALATKHSMVAAPAAALAWLAWHDRPRAVRLALWTGGLTLAWLAACWAAFGSVFFLNVGPYTTDIPWAWRNVVVIWKRALGVWYLPAIVATAAYAVWALRMGGPRDRLVAIYGLAASATLVLVAKEGSSLLYLVEYSVAAALVLACAVGRLLEAPALKSPGRRLAASLAVALSLFFLQVPVEGYPLSRRMWEAKRLWHFGWDALLKRDEQMISVIRRVEGPVLAEEPFYVLAAGKPVLANTFILKWLAQGGRWDERPLIRDIARHRFALIQLNAFAVPPEDRPMTDLERLNYRLTRIRFSPGVLRAIDLWYEVPGRLRDYPLGKIYVPK